MTLSEVQIQTACSQILELDGWRLVKTDLRHLRGLGVQEKGMADSLYIRYALVVPIPPLPIQEDVEFEDDPNNDQVMWIEWKRINKRGNATKTSSAQDSWHTLERARGALTLIAGVDFPATIDGFRSWYKISGLMRGKILS